MAEQTMAAERAESLYLDPQAEGREKGTLGVTRFFKNLRIHL